MGGTNRRRNAPGAQVKDFVPLVCPKSSRPLDLEEDEEDEEMTRLLDRYVARKLK